MKDTETKVKASLRRIIFQDGQSCWHGFCETAMFRTATKGFKDKDLAEIALKGWMRDHGYTPPGKLDEEEVVMGMNDIAS